MNSSAKTTPSIISSSFRFRRIHESILLAGSSGLAVSYKPRLFSFASHDCSLLPSAWHHGRPQSGHRKCRATVLSLDICSRPNDLASALNAIFIKYLRPSDAWLDIFAQCSHDMIGTSQLAATTRVSDTQPAFTFPVDNLTPEPARPSRRPLTGLNGHLNPRKHWPFGTSGRL